MLSNTQGSHQLVRCEPDGFPSPIHPAVADELIEMCQMTSALYSSIGFNPPWVGYLAMVDGNYVGGGAFVGAPKDGRVEISYFTLPPHESRGYASLTAQKLVSIARTTDSSVTINAKTMPEENASTAILRRLGFIHAGTVLDEEIGEAWLWSLT